MRNWDYFERLIESLSPLIRESGEGERARERPKADSYCVWCVCTPSSNCRPCLSLYLSSLAFSSKWKEKTGHLLAFACQGQKAVGYGFNCVLSTPFFHPPFFHLWQACCLVSTACEDKPENRVTVAKPLVASISWVSCYKINTVSLIYKRSEVGRFRFQGHISAWGDQFAHFTFTFYTSLLACCCLKDKWSN